MGRITCHPLAVAVVVNVLLFAVFFALAEPRFETNDDQGMMFLAQGSKDYEPTEHLVFTNVIVGLILKTLYSWTENINWYSLYLYMFHGLAMVVLLYVLLDRRFSFLAMGVFFLFFVGFELHFLMYLQFTTTAYVVTQSAILLILCGSLGMKRWSPLIAGGLLIVIGGLIRVHSMWLAILLAAPLILYTVYRTRSFCVVFLLAGAIALSFGTTLYDDWYYMQDEEWHAYAQWNKDRGALQIALSGIDADKAKAALPEVDWSVNDLVLYRNWFFADPVTYSNEKLAALAVSLNQLGSRRTLQEVWAYLRQCVRRDVRFGMFAVLGLTTSLLAMCTRKMFHLAVLLLLGGVALCVCVYLSWTLKLPTRVLAPVFASVTIGSLFLGLEQLSAEPKPRIRPSWWRHGKLFLAAFILGCCGYAFAMQLADVVAQTRANLISQEEYKAAAVALNRAFELDTDEDVVFILSGGVLPQELASPLWRPDEYLQLPRIEFGCFAYSPYFQPIWDRLPSENAFLALIERSKTYLFVFEKHLDWIAAFMREHCGIAIEFTAEHTFLPEPKWAERSVYRILVREDGMRT